MMVDLHENEEELLRDRSPSPPPRRNWADDEPAAEPVDDGENNPVSLMKS